MKILINDDSVFGNTEKIAQALAAALGTQAVPVGQADAGQLGGWLTASPRSLIPSRHLRIIGRSPNSTSKLNRAAGESQWYFMRIRVTRRVRFCPSG
jgi:hypothetical protein